MNIQKYIFFLWSALGSSQYSQSNNIKVFIKTSTTSDQQSDLQNPRDQKVKSCVTYVLHSWLMYLVFVCMG